MLHIHTFWHTRTQTQASPESCPCLFSDLQWCRGEVGTARAIQYLRSSLSLLVPWIPLPSLYQAEVMDASLSRAWRRTEKNSRENKEKRLSNYFKQRTKLKHCAEPSKGSASGALRFFPAVWGEGNAKGICAELTVKGEREREREKTQKKEYTWVQTS